MVCIYCAQKTTVTNSRPSKRSVGTWRRRHCTACGAIFTSREHADISQTHRVQQSNNDITPYSRDRLFISLHRSCGHRETALTDAAALADTITSVIIKNLATDGVVHSRDITTTVYETLQRFDSAAATYYKAYFVN